MSSIITITLAETGKRLRRYWLTCLPVDRSLSLFQQEDDGVPKHKTKRQIKRMRKRRLNRKFGNKGARKNR